jgi:hypothetical protein
MHDVLIGKPNGSIPLDDAMSSAMARALYLDAPAEPFLSPTALIGVPALPSFLLLLSWNLRVVTASLIHYCMGLPMSRGGFETT